MKVQAAVVEVDVIESAQAVRPAGAPGDKPSGVEPSVGLEL
jgi:hypothetical protein